jgi:hypothetical protein
MLLEAVANALGCRLTYKKVSVPITIQAIRTDTNNQVSPPSFWGKPVCQ